MRSGFVTATQVPWTNGSPLPERESPYQRRERLLTELEEAAKVRDFTKIQTLSSQLEDLEQTVDI